MSPVSVKAILRNIRIPFKYDHTRNAVGAQSLFKSEDPK
jgi:hypothetical protein